MLTVVEKVGSAWDGIPAISIRRSWKKLIPMEEESDSLLVESNDTEDTSDFAEELTSLGHAITPAEVEAWEKEDGAGYDQLDEDSILELVQGQGESATQYESDKDEDDISDEEDISKTVLCLTVKHWMPHRNASPGYIINLSLVPVIWPLSSHLGILLHLNVSQGSSKPRYHPFSVEHSVWSSMNFYAFDWFSCICI